jgi:hypothetical protein
VEAVGRKRKADGVEVGPGEPYTSHVAGVGDGFDVYVDPEGLSGICTTLKSVIDSKYCIKSGTDNDPPVRLGDGVLNLPAGAPDIPETSDSPLPHSLDDFGMESGDEGTLTTHLREQGPPPSKRSPAASEGPQGCVTEGDDSFRINKSNLLVELGKAAVDDGINDLIKHGDVGGGLGLLCLRKPGINVAVGRRGVYEISEIAIGDLDACVLEELVEDRSRGVGKGLLPLVIHVGIAIAHHEISGGGVAGAEGERGHFIFLRV